MTKVFVTGASGFIAQNIIKTFLDAGYLVVGTVRSAVKGEKLKTFFGERFSYEIVEDMIKEGAFDLALKNNKEVKYLLHTASPFFYDTTDPEKDLIIPAIKGTENILKSIKKYGENVERVIITSSDAALYSFENERNKTLHLDESSWNQISYEDAVKDPISAYYGAKTFAEKLAWRFVESESPKFKLVAINPVYVFGPQVILQDAKGSLNTSNELIASILKLKDDNFQTDDGGFVDVRDVAKAHLVAVENDDAVGQRLFLTGGNFSTQMILDIINERFPELGLPKGKPGNGPKEIEYLASTDNSKTRAVLNFELTGLEKIIVDTVNQILY